MRIELRYSGQLVEIVYESPDGPLERLDGDSPLLDRVRELAFGDGPDPIVIGHDPRGRGWGGRGRYPNNPAWFLQAVRQLLADVDVKVDEPAIDDNAAARYGDGLTVY